MNVLITGAAGYIGNILTRVLCRMGYRISIYDTDTDRLEKLGLRRFSWGRVDQIEEFREPYTAVVHLGGLIDNRQSIENPLEYAEANVVTSLKLIQAIKIHNEQKTNPCSLVFISSAAALSPTTPYGYTKRFIDDILPFCNMPFSSLRLYNVAGAWIDKNKDWHGERHNPETHLIPNVINCALKKEKLIIYGRKTVRDYIHVEDVVKSIIWYMNYPANDIVPIGTGIGYENQTVVDMIFDQLGVDQLDRDIEYQDPRPGDADVLVSPKPDRPFMYSLGTIIKSAIEWHRTI